MTWWLAVAVAWAVDVEVVHEPRKDAWQVVWTVDRPVRGLLFARNRNPVQAAFRTRSRQADLEGHQVLLAPAGKGATTFEASFRTDTRSLEKDYDLNVAFGDGARLLYVDHLFVVPLVCPDGGLDCPDAALERLEPEPHRYRFSTAADLFVVTPEGRSQGEATWTQRGEGVYVYFGTGEPLPDDRVRFLLDPTLPDWVVARSREWIGPLIDHFTEQTGRILSFQPVVFVSWGAGGEGQRDASGGGLPGQMQLHLEGQGWATESDESRERYARFLAHELFHMWNGEELSTWVDASEEWLSEGSADLFSLWALRALDVLDEAGVRARVRDAASRCAGHLGQDPLLTAHRRGRYEAFYSCGATGLFVLDAALRRHGTSLPTVFTDVFAEGTRYSTYDLLEAAHQRTGDPLVHARLEQLLRGGLGPAPIETLAAWLTEAGLPTATADPWTVEAAGDHLLHDALAMTIAACDCGGAISMWNHGVRLELDPLPACERLRDGMIVTGVAAGPVLPKRDALARAWAEIDASGTLTLDGPDGSRTLTCVGVPRPQALLAHE